MKCEHCGAFTGDLEAVAMELVAALKGVGYAATAGDGHLEGARHYLSSLFEYLAIPLDNAIRVADREKMKGGTDE